VSDLDGDGYDELVVAVAPDSIYDSPGFVAVVGGSGIAGAAATTPGLVDITALPQVTIHGTGRGFGAVTCVLGDVDGDGVDDVASQVADGYAVWSSALFSQGAVLDAGNAEFPSEL
jgi:hypothetical protein